MDNLTHSLTGLMLSRAGFARLHVRAPLALILAANAPDVDGLSIVGGVASYIRFHRGLAHSIAFLPIMAILPLLIVCAIARSFKGWLRLYLLCLIGVASHLLLDWTNTYGVRLMIPFSYDWYHGDLNNLTDFWILAVLLLAWLMVYVVRMVNTEIGARPGSGRGMAIFALVFFLVFDYGKFLAHQRALEMLNSRIYGGAIPMRVAAFPSGSNPMMWHSWVETSTFFKRFDVNVTQQFDPGAGTTFYKPEPTPAIATARATPAFQRFLTFDQYPRWTVTPTAEPEGGNRVELLDLRFPFRSVAIVDRSNRVLRAWLQF